ncbi:hypothetical protein [Lacticaseibacillus paracasei]|uniref:hypothetical protein n=1 Tax=Lacticaseibacillus paracasei TaxID=1597 RepID=UPI00019C9911|nr:hypothetical protein [Lacticaseibacillus paracasei]EEI67807.1 hypothetical protein HMPREF0530_1925 [Lacticaseibacillus paracasei subsp. paracasei ATCC 25302 = DSM 5622 = JCM 8130]KRM63829.1 hypothetical protein FC74_GL002274 [Lacticaseibacillus paracasei subsp. paracasei ATCC 25302 = DSM 5622 = JCM 8130]MBA4475131.1 hypothetical protein [Lacticaseibacillus paracasei]RNE19124.1 hypothetical protein FAM3257_02193 [Lacticaseibacillus paracasei]TDG88580.1 hypothetical protein C5L26_002968 [Lact
MSEEKFDKLCDDNFDELVELVFDDTDFIEDLLRDNQLSDVVYGWFHDHHAEVMEYLGEAARDEQ